MAFRLLPNEYFQGIVVEPEGTRRDVVVVKRATRAAVVSMTLAEARKRNWDWTDDGITGGNVLVLDAAAAVASAADW